MTKTLLLLFILSTTSVFAFAQQLKGKLADSQTHTRIRGASVSIKSRTDPSFSRYAVSDTSGSFIFPALTSGIFDISVTYIDYGNSMQAIQVDSAVSDLGTILLTRNAGILDSVVIIAKTPMAGQKGDTIQLNASQFKVNPDATVEDLAKKMPGITIQNGQVMAHGENVQKVTLDGRDLFGDDATAALRNLPAEIVDKIQIFDRLSDQAQFTGYDDGTGSKSINIVTKANMRNGQYGRVFAGYGTDDRYQAGGNTAILKGVRRISVVENFNNVNQQNFSSQDLFGVTSSQSRGGQAGGNRGKGGAPSGGNNSNFLVGQQNGINRTAAAGINYTDNWGPKLVFTGSYFFNDAHNTTNELVDRHYVLAGIPNFTQASVADGNNTNHRINMRFEYKIDSANQLIITPNLNFQNNNSLTRVSTGFFDPSLATLNNKTDNTNNSKRGGNNLSNSILFRHSFPKKGRTFSINLQTGYNRRTGNVYTDLFDTTFSGGSYTDSTSHRFTDQFINGHQLSANLIYTEPLSKKAQLQVNYNPSYTKSKADQEAYQLDETSDKYSVFDPNLSSKFNNNIRGQNAGLGYRYGTKETQFNAGFNYQRSELSSNQQFPRTLKVDKTFYNILPNAMLRLKLNTKSNIRFLYRASTNQPSVTQLQDVYDYTNLPFVIAGNPDLAQQFTQTISTRYTYSNTNKSTLLVGNVFLQTASNYITNATYVPLRDSSLTPDLLPLPIM